MLLKRFVDVFRQCKQLLNNKKLQLSSYNNKLKLKISWTQSIKKVAFNNYIYNKLAKLLN